MRVTSSPAPQASLPSGISAVPPNAGGGGRFLITLANYMPGPLKPLPDGGAIGSILFGSATDIGGAISLIA